MAGRFTTRHFFVQQSSAFALPDKIQVDKRGFFWKARALFSGSNQVMGEWHFRDMVLRNGEWRCWCLCENCVKPDWICTFGSVSCASFWQKQADFYEEKRSFLPVWAGKFSILPEKPNKNLRLFPLCIKGFCAILNAVECDAKTLSAHQFCLA